MHLKRNKETPRSLNMRFARLLGQDYQPIRSARGRIAHLQLEKLGVHCSDFYTEVHHISKNSISKYIVQL